MGGRWGFRHRAVWLLLAAVLGACGGSTDEGGGGPKISADAVVFDSTKVAIVADSAAQAAGTYTFNVTGAAPAVVAGDVIVGAEGGGYLRRVNSVQSAGGQLILATSPAALTDVVTEGTLSDSVTLDLTDTAPIVGPGGVQWGATRIIGASGPIVIQNGAIVLDGTVLVGDQTTNITIDAGRLKFTPKLKLDWHIRQAQVQDVTVSATGTLDLDLDVSASTTVALLDISHEKALFTLTKPFLAFIGGVPVAGEIILSFKGTLDAGVNAALSVSAGMTSSQSVTVGAQYQKTANPQWSPILTSSSTFTPQPLTFNNPVDAYVEAGAKVELRVTLYKVAGPFIYTKAGANFHAVADLVQATWTKTCQAKVSAGLGFDFKILSLVLVQFTTSRNLYTQDFCTQTDPLPPVATNISSYGGNNQSAPILTPLPIPLTAKVADNANTGVPGVPVVFTVTQGGGSFGGLGQVTVQSDAQGLAQASLVLGPAAGQNVVTAAATGLQGSPVTFIATATSGPQPPAFADDFSGTLAGWVEVDPGNGGSWVIQNGNVLGDYGIGCGSTTCAQIELLLTPANQPATTNWRMEVDMDSVTSYNQGSFQAVGSFARWSLWVSNSEKTAVEVGKGVQGLTLPATFTNIIGTAASYPWATIATNTINVTWDPRVRQTAALEKNGNTYTVFFNGAQVLQFTKTFSVPPQVGFHTYGKVRMDNFRLYTLP